MLRDARYGAQLQSAIGSTFLHLSGFAFVDDSNIIQDVELGESMASIIRKAQKQLDLWESGIRSMGGCIDGDKSDLIVINYAWQDREWKCETTNTENKLTTNNTNNMTPNKKG